MNPKRIILAKRGPRFAGALLVSLLSAFVPATVHAQPIWKGKPIQVEIAAPFPGASAEDVEGHVTVPLEFTVAFLDGLDKVRSQSRAGLAVLQLQFQPGLGIDKARQQVVALLRTVQRLPPGVIPMVSLATPSDEILRYTLHSPTDEASREIYTSYDLRSLQEHLLEREFRRVPGVVDVVSAGGTVKRYEIHLDPQRLRRFDLTLKGLENALTCKVQEINLPGGEKVPVQQVLDVKDPDTAAAEELARAEKAGSDQLPRLREEQRRRLARVAADRLRQEEKQRLLALRKRVIASPHGKEIRLEDVVEGGPLAQGQQVGSKGVVIDQRPGWNQVRLDPDEPDKVEGIVLARPGQDRRQTLLGVEERIKELNAQSGRLLPGVRIEPYCRAPSVGWTTIPGVEGPTLHVLASFPPAVSPQQASKSLRSARAQLLRQPEVRAVLRQIAPLEEGATEGWRVGLLISLRPEKDWPAVPGSDRFATRITLADDLLTELAKSVPDIDWQVDLAPIEPFQSAFVPGRGKHLLKIFGPDLERLHRLAVQARNELAKIEGLQNVHVRASQRVPTLAICFDREKCGLSQIADINDILQIALGGKTFPTRIEGEKTFDITLRCPTGQIGKEAILDRPVDLPNGPRIRMRDLLAERPLERAGAGMISRENGQQLISICLRVQGPKAAAALIAARRKVAPLIQASYRAEWVSGSE